MKNSSWITKCGIIFLYLGGSSIALILISVLVTGSWNKSPEIVQEWGHILRTVADIPIIGNFTLLLWGVFLVPGYLILLFGKKFENTKLDNLNKTILHSNSISSEKANHVENREDFPFKVFIDDNFNYMDENERYQIGEYETEEEAISVCKQVVDDYLLSSYEPSMTAEQLLENYVNFGDDPFIRGGGTENSFSAWDYAKTRVFEICEAASQPIKNESNKAKILDSWKFELDYKYGLLLPESEIMEDEGRLYFCQTNKKKLCVAWDKENEIWEVNINRKLLEGLSFSTPKRFDQVVFGEKDNAECYLRKQYFIEYLLVGCETGKTKVLTKEVNNSSTIEFFVPTETWNEMLIGNPVGLETWVCKYFEKGGTKEQMLRFALLSKNWDITIEFVLSDYENFEQHTFGIKTLGGYYNEPI